MVTDRLKLDYCDCCGALESYEHHKKCIYYGVPPVLRPQTKDTVNHPSHYTAGKVEVIDYIEQVCSHYPGSEAPLVANMIKYASRAPLKGKKLEDLKKAQWYLNRLVSALENNN